MRNVSKRNKKPRVRVETTITIYGPDRRKKAAKYTKVQYSDGRKFTRSKLYRGNTQDSVKALLADYYDSVKLLK